MPKFIILAGGGKAQSWEIPSGSSVIGRDNDATLCLPNVSVSRRHAQISPSNEHVLEKNKQGESLVIQSVVRVHDLESRNGIMINDQPVDAANMKAGDILRVGKFQLALVEDNDAFYRGRAIKYMPTWTGVATAQNSTVGMSPTDLKRMLRRQMIIDKARIILATNQKRYWFPEESTLTLGGDGMIHVEGLRARGIAAQITWDGNAHTITKKGLLSQLKINGNSVSTHALKSMDNVEICGTRFVYAIPD
jgi:pSer/pThr/pTyr-binding forkhead associated (FHA) protein